MDASRTTEQDWNLLQICISLMQNIGAFHTEVVNLEDRISGMVLATNTRLEENEFFQYQLTGKLEIAEFKKIVIQIHVSNKGNSLFIHKKIFFLNLG